MSAEDYFPAAQRDLWKLIDQRRAAGAEVEPIDQRIWERFGDEGAILYTDLVGFTRQTAAIGITHFLQTILESHCLLRPIIACPGTGMSRMQPDQGNLRTIAAVSGRGVRPRVAGGRSATGGRRIEPGLQAGRRPGCGS